jgi:hypothetical protein
VAVLLFSEIGWGVTVFSFLAKHSQLANTIMSGTFILMLLLYSFDFSHWGNVDGKWQLLQYFAAVILLGGFSSACVLLFADYPTAPMCLYLAAQLPWFWLGAVVSSCCTNRNNRNGNTVSESKLALLSNRRTTFLGRMAAALAGTGCPVVVRLPHPLLSLIGLLKKENCCPGRVAVLDIFSWKRLER